MKLKGAAAVCSLVLLATQAAIAAELSDTDLVRLCADEIKSRQPPGEVQENSEVVASHVERAERQQVVDVQVTEAEGRPVAGRCIIRNGKIFDFKG